MRLIPSFIYRQIEHRPNLAKILDNISWLFFDKILRMAMSLFIGVWVARYLGPEQFGILNYTIAFVMLFGVVAGLGLNPIVIRDLVREPLSKNNILGTAFILQILAGTIACGLAIITINIIHRDEQLIKALVAIMSFTLIIKSADIVKCWYESQVKSKYIVWIEITVLLIISIVRIYLIIFDYPIESFIWAMFFESVVLSVSYFILYGLMVNSIVNWNPTLEMAKRLISNSWPVILTSGVATINMRLDQVMLGNMTTNTILGNYSAAVRLAEVWFFIPTIIGPSIFPAIVSAKKESEELYRIRILKVVKYMAMFALPVALIISIYADVIIELIFGEQYIIAADYLALYIWIGIPNLLFFAVYQMFYTEGMVKVMSYISVVTLICNVALNFMLIPIYGGMGAIIATFIATYLSYSLGLIIINKKARIFSGF